MVCEEDSAGQNTQQITEEGTIFFNCVPYPLNSNGNLCWGLHKIVKQLKKSDFGIQYYLNACYAKTEMYV